MWIKGELGMAPAYRAQVKLRTETRSCYGGYDVQFPGHEADVLYWKEKVAGSAVEEHHGQASSAGWVHGIQEIIKAGREVLATKLKTSRNKVDLGKLSQG